MLKTGKYKYKSQKMALWKERMQFYSGRGKVFLVDLRKC